MKISRVGEFGLIDIINKISPVKNKDVVAGIGEDAAVFKLDGRYGLLTTDTVVENIHFNFRYTNYYELGWKLTAVNLSDIAAMGGDPKYALVTLGLKGDVEVSDIKAFYRGAGALAKKYGVSIIGGDIVRSPKAVFFTMDLFGYAKKPVLRSTARPGDLLMVAGKSGASSVGLKALRAGRKGDLVRAHLRPMPMLREGKILAKFATSMIDNSDGLARCLLELSKSAGVGFKVRLDRIPLAEGASLDDALNGGEDYNLVLTARKPLKGAKVIGEVTRGRKIVLVDKQGREKVLAAGGFEHF